MAISPMDIHLKEFSTTGTEGYDKEEVDSFLEGVAEELERLSNRNKELEESLARIMQKASQFDEMQKTLQTALMNAQKSAGNILQEARSQAATIINKAQDRSDRILEDMEKERKRLLADFARIREQILEQVSPMRDLLEKSRSLLQEYEEQARKADIDVAAADTGESDVMVEQSASPSEEELQVDETSEVEAEDKGDWD